jgi:hypothetical protein
MVSAGNAVKEMLCELERRNPKRTETVAYLNARLAEINARKAFHQDPTPENLTAWCDANEAVDSMHEQGQP